MMEGLFTGGKRACRPKPFSMTLHLLSEEGATDLANIDEFFWEHHIYGNYLMRGIWGVKPGQDDRSIRESAELFLQLRQRGVRSHSWV